MWYRHMDPYLNCALVVQDFVFATIDAFLTERGVQTAGLKRLPSLLDDTLYSEQCQLRRVAPLPTSYSFELAEYPPFELDSFSETSIYVT